MSDSVGISRTVVLASDIYPPHLVADAVAKATQQLSFSRGPESLTLTPLFAVGGSAIDEFLTGLLRTCMASHLNDPQIVQ